MVTIFHISLKNPLPTSPCPAEKGGKRGRDDIFDIEGDWTLFHDNACLSHRTDIANHRPKKKKGKRPERRSELISPGSSVSRGKKGEGRSNKHAEGPGRMSPMVGHHRTVAKRRGGGEKEGVFMKRRKRYTVS